MKSSTMQGLGLLMTVLLLQGCAEDGNTTAPSVAALPLAQATLPIIGGSSAASDSIHLMLLVGPLGEEKKVFDFWATESDAGTTIRVDGSTNEEFSAAVDFLTNGEDDLLFMSRSFTDTRGGGKGSGESALLQGGLDGSYHPDLAGAEITHLLVHRDRIELDSPGEDPNNDGDWTDFDLELRVVFVGRP